MTRRIKATATALIGTALLSGGAFMVERDAFAQDFDRDRERLRECDPSTQDCDQLQQQVTQRLRQQIRDCQPGTQQCDQLRSQLREVEQWSKRNRYQTGASGGGRSGGSGGSGGGSGRGGN